MHDTSLGFRHLVGMIVLLLSLGFFADGQLSRGITVYGRVFLPDSQPATQTTVNITGQNGYVASAVTDGRGGFRFEGIPRAIYSLNVTVPRSAKYLAEPVSVDARDGTSFMADIFLRDPLESSAVKEKSSGVISVREAEQRIPKDARKAFEKAQKYREQKKYEAALSELEKAVVIYPDYFQAFAEKGVVRINSGHPREALRDFHKAFQIFPEYEPALSGAGYCQLTLGNYEQAIALLERAHQLDPTHTQNLLFMGISNLALKRWQQAQAALEKALKLDANGMATAHLYLADAFAGQNLYERAADELRIYLQSNPNAPNAERVRQREKQLRTKISAQD